ncbi:hypothetical protein ACNOYE_06000 [Nannocystaceae bacterium ST9]
MNGMNGMTVDELVRRLDRLDHTERLAELIAHGRALSPTDAEALSRALFAGDVHRRLLALQLAQLVSTGARPSALIWQALDDRSLAVRSLAAKLVGRDADAVPIALLDRLDAASLSVLFRRVVRQGRAAIAEPLVEGLIARERMAEACYLLPVCRVEAILGWLDAVAWPETIWIRLAKYRAPLLIDRITAAFAATPERPDLIWRRFHPGVWARLARREPATLAAWIDRHADAESLPHELASALPHLVRWSPTWIAGVLGARVAWVAQIGLPKGLAARASEVDDATLAPLVRGLARSAPHLLGQLLARMPYPRRASLFALAIEPLETARIEWPTSLLAVLPTALRDREAARMLALTRARTDATWRRELLGLRSIVAARPELEREGQSAQASDRAEAHAALVRSSWRSRAGMPETLAWLKRIRNEQDPVRLAVMIALAEAPGHHFDDPGALDLVVAPIFDARDTSYATRHQVARLAHRLMVARATEPSSPMFEFGISLLERLAGQAGTPDLPNLERNLPRGAEQAIVDALLPWAEAAGERRQEDHLVRLWTSLGKRAWKVAALGERIAHLIWQGSKAGAPYRVAHWLADPRTRDARVRELVKRDRSALYLHPVFEHCHRRRQSLLVDRFATTAPRGRFHDGKVVLIPIVDRGFERWPSELQRQYVELIALAEIEPKHFSQTRAALISMRARVPITRVEDFADALASSEVPVREAALAALVWTDDPAPALAILLDHLEGDQARVAMYAMPRLARLIARDRFVDALAELLARPKLKVTVHKEALRLLGQLATPRAIALLRQTWTQPLHRDVRIATLHAARSILSQADAWTILAEAARDGDADIVRALVEVPLITIAERHRGRYLEVMRAVVDHASPIARAALFATLVGGWSSVDPRVAVEIATKVIARMDPSDPWRAAAQVVAEGARSSDVHARIEASIAELIAAAERDVAPAGERDRIAHQRLVGVIEGLANQRHPIATVLLERLAAALLSQPHWWWAGARLRIAAASNERLASVCVELIRAAPSERSRRVIEDAARAAAQLALRDWSASEAEQALADLRAGEAGVVAVAMLAVFGPRWGWGAGWVAELGELREDPELDVRLAARAVWLVSG